MLVDSHCHLDFPDFQEERDQVVQRAREAGVGLMLTICTHASRFEQVWAVAQAYPTVYCTLGIHPHHALDEATHSDVAHLVALAGRPKVAGIGETGLDYYYDQSPRDVQQESFRRHIRVCLETGLPLIVHTRDAEEDTIRILREEGAGKGLKGLLHCFSSSRRLAEEALEFGFHISFSGIVTFKKSEDLREIARMVPLDRMLVETDAPYLAPVPLRGKRNEPAFTVHTARLLAEVKGVSYDALATATTANFLNLFDRVPADALAG
ncbi:TatD family hydrolase [Rhodospirillum centenum]|uniref:Hydrolase, TatD family n=1 Tax=Rhodospirillum centenum (strain ATCC 51521 / SW) TaxID=414684 RepID=B6IMK5_RHOCS|nr:TatD family hydrolase [Rhodospirillum centenum]ACI98584.1 hydrolase, TatD family [Rhodospirillum centenum SW]